MDEHRLPYARDMNTIARDARTATGRTKSSGLALVAVARLVLAALILASVVATFVDVAGRAAINPFNFFGYFTIQSNILMGVVWAWVGVAGLARRPLPPAADHARGITTTYVAIVGIVYALLLAPLGAAGGVPLPWANAVLHIVVPIAACLDWIVVADRTALRWRRLPLVLIYPLVWLGVVLVRGATDGWVPYPFLHPDLGYGAISLTVLAIAAATVAVGAAVFALSRVTLWGRRLRR